MAVACRICDGRVESKELNDSVPVFLRRCVLVLLPFLNRTVGDSKSQDVSELRHGKVEVNALFAKVFADGFWVGRVVAQLLEMKGIC